MLSSMAANNKTFDVTYLLSDFSARVVSTTFIVLSLPNNLQASLNGVSPSLSF